MSAALQDLARAQAAASTPTVRLIRGDAVDMERQRWLWKHFLPAGMLTILGGAPGCGKTTIALSFAATASRGGLWPDGSRCSAAGDVVIWSGEDPHSVLAARLCAMGANMQRIHFVDGIVGSEGEPFDPGRDMQLLETTLEALPSPQLLILDPIVSAVTGDSHKGAEVRRSLQPVVDLGRRRDCSVMGITHFSKGTGGRDPVERITGSIAFAALARLVLVAAKVQAEEDGGEPRRVLMRAKSNIGPDDGGFHYSLDRIEIAPEIEGQRIAWGEPLQGSAREVLAQAEATGAEDDGETSALEDACEFLRSELAAGPQPAKRLFAEARGAGHSERTLKRAKAHLGAESRKESTGWVWALTKSAKGALDGPLGHLGTVEPEMTNSASESTSGILGTVGPLGTLGTVESDAEVL